MATTLLSDRFAPRVCTGFELLEQRDGDRAEQAVARVALGHRGKGREASRRFVAAAVRGITAAATCIAVRAREDA